MKRYIGQKWKSHKAIAVIEYAILIILVMVALFTFRDYILRGFQGNYKQMGESVSFHRQYNAYATISCRCDFAARCEADGKTCHDAGLCYDEMCFDGHGCEGYDKECILKAKTNCFVERCQPESLGPPVNSAL